ncbi:glycosyl hydrolase [Kiritimatiellaeota bacterium B1221]|nr:glycosyl hydrolase [Kiritimatiellaeota bacterium B1221]
MLLILSGACRHAPLSPDQVQGGVPADGTASDETRALLFNLWRQKSGGILFGHQDSLAYGIGWRGGMFESDIQKVSGKYPAVFGWDVGEVGHELNIDRVRFEDMRQWIISVYERGGINTISWHLDNPVTLGDAWDVTPAVHQILPGGEKHADFKESLDLLAEFLGSLKTEAGVAVPIIFRPWHELNGDWFWWGEASCSPEEYKQLYRFTGAYLTREKGLHHLLFCFSPDVVETEEAYLERYPGDDVVDILGLCDYSSFVEAGPGFESLRIVAELAQKRHKPFALAETGVDQLMMADWWTEGLLRPINNDPLSRQVSYVLVWRNATLDHFYGPYPGHLAAENFIEFAKDPNTRFLRDLSDMYQSPHTEGSGLK